MSRRCFSSVIYDTTRYDAVIFTCAQKLTRWPSVIL